MNRRGQVTKAKLFTATFRMMENIKEINVAEIFVAAVDDIDPEAMFDLRGRDLSAVFSDGSIANNVHGPCELEGSEDDGPGDISARKHIADVGAQRTTE